MRDTAAPSLTNAVIRHPGFMVDAWDVEVDCPIPSQG